MSAYLKHEELEVLMQLHHYHMTGESGPEPSPKVISKLESERLVEHDEYGSVKLTERGMRHVHEMLRSGEWKSDKEHGGGSRRCL